MSDPLYALFEHHLLTALVEDETTDNFLIRVVTSYMGCLMSEGLVPASLRESLEQDLRDEVLEMFRKKTYGHYNLASFRKSNGIETTASTQLLDLGLQPENEKARRGGRAC